MEIQTLARCVDTLAVGNFAERFLGNANRVGQRQK
jgi:hypothetical protein